MGHNPRKPDDRLTAVVWLDRRVLLCPDCAAFAADRAAKKRGMR